MRFRKIWWGSWWWLEELCEVPRCLLWGGLRHHCPVYNVYCIFFNKCFFFIVHGWILTGQISYITIKNIYKIIENFLNFTNYMYIFPPKILHVLSEIKIWKTVHYIRNLKTHSLWNSNMIMFIKHYHEFSFFSIIS